MATNFAVKLEKNESPDGLIKRFLKKSKKLRIVEDYIERTSYYKPKSVKRREEKDRARRRYLRESNKQNDINGST